MKKITKEEMHNLIESYNNGNEIPKERFWCEEDGRYVEMDNTDGFCYVSDWDTLEECIMRCLGYLDTDGNPYDIQKLCKDFMSMVNHIIFCDEDEAANTFEWMNMPRELANY